MNQNLVAEGTPLQKELLIKEREWLAGSSDNVKCRAICKRDNNLEVAFKSSFLLVLLQARFGNLSKSPRQIKLFECITRGKRKWRFKEINELIKCVILRVGL